MSLNMSISVCMPGLYSACWALVNQESGFYYLELFNFDAVVFPSDSEGLFCHLVSMFDL